MLIEIVPLFVQPITIAKGRTKEYFRDLHDDSHPEPIPSQLIKPSLLESYRLLDIDDFDSFKAFVERFGIYNTFLPLVPPGFLFGGSIRVKSKSDVFTSVWGEKDIKDIWLSIKSYPYPDKPELGLFRSDVGKDKDWLEHLADGGDEFPLKSLGHLIRLADENIALRLKKPNKNDDYVIFLTGLNITGGVALDAVRLMMARTSHSIRPFLCQATGCENLIPEDRPRSSYCSQACANNASRKREPRVIRERLTKRARDQWGTGSAEYEKFYRALQKSLKGAETDQDKIDNMEALSIKYGLGSVTEKNKPGRKKKGA